jgi:hypothetical protein
MRTLCLMTFRKPYSNVINKAIFVTCIQTHKHSLTYTILTGTRLIGERLYVFIFATVVHNMRKPAADTNGRFYYILVMRKREIAVEEPCLSSSDLFVGNMYKNVTEILKTKLFDPSIL